MAMNNVIEYRRKYHQEHREKLVEYGRLYRLTNREKLNADARAKRAAFPEMFRAREKTRQRPPGKKKEYWRTSYDRNRESILSWHRQWAKDHPEARRAATKKYRAKRPEILAIFNGRRRVRRLRAIGRHSLSDILKIWLRQGHKCAVPGCPHPISDQARNNKYHVDHIVALLLNGSNWPENIQILCAFHNHQKHSLPVETWFIRLRQEATTYCDEDRLCLYTTGLLLAIPCRRTLDSELTPKPPLPLGQSPDSRLS